MSSSMPIPRREEAQRDAAPSSFSSSASSSYSTPISSSSPLAPTSSSSKGKAAVSSPSTSERIAPRRPSLLGMFQL